jgi:mitochondrial fission protein ELM1
LFRWRDEEWRLLVAFLGESRRTHGIRWIVSTSRRTPDAVANLLVGVARNADGPIAELIDFRVAGPGTLPRLFAGVDAILATEDSSTMLSEAVCAQLPVVGVAPADHDFKDEEREYRALMTREGWCRSLPLSALTPASFVAALAEVRPLSENHLDRLAAALAERLPELFRDRS